MSFKCPKGFDECIKTCSTVKCRETCEYTEECCTKYCIFEPGNWMARMQQEGEEGKAFNEVMTELFGEEVTG